MPRRTNLCLKCKYSVLTGFKPEYGGRVLGCTRTDTKDFRMCYEPKEDKKKSEDEADD